MNWKTMGASCTVDSIEALEALFWQTGAVSVTITDAANKPLFEPGPGETPLWNEMTATGLYEETVDVDFIRSELKSKNYVLLYVETLGDRIWEREWLSRFKPMCFGERLWVCPTSCEVKEAGAIIMELDPGLAFGTGTHATTKMCLEWLDANIRPGMKVLDFGSGSGILGIAALLLGADSVLAIDNDPQALRASMDNATRNGVQDRLETRLPSESKLEQFDLVIANILAQPLIDLSEQLFAAMNDSADLVLSGIMDSQADWVKQAYPLSFLSENSCDGWVCLHARND